MPVMPDILHAMQCLPASWGAQRGEHAAGCLCHRRGSTHGAHAYHAKCSAAATACVRTVGEPVVRLGPSVRAAVARARHAAQQRRGGLRKVPARMILSRRPLWHRVATLGVLCSGK